MQFYADRFCFNWNTKHLPLEERMNLFFQRMATTEYAPLEDIKPEGETGRKSAKWYTEQRIKNGKDREQEQWLRTLRRQELIDRNLLLEIQFLLAEISIFLGPVTNCSITEINERKISDKHKNWYVTLKNHQNSLYEYENKVITKCKESIEHADSTSKRIPKHCEAILAEYEYVKNISNKRERMAEIKRRLKLADKVGIKKFKNFQKSVVFQ